MIQIKMNPKPKRSSTLAYYKKIDKDLSARQTLSLKKVHQFVKMWHYRNRNPSSVPGQFIGAYLTRIFQTTISGNLQVTHYRSILQTTFVSVPGHILSSCPSLDGSRFVNAPSLINKKDCPF